MISGVVAGSSLTRTTVSALPCSSGYSVACDIEILNLTKYTLEKPMAFNKGGLIKIPPVHVIPGVKETMVTHKTGGTPTGTYGTVSWFVKDRRVVVMWSVPFNQSYYRNWLAVGLTKPGDIGHEKDWFDIMYNKTSTSLLSFTRKEFYKDVNPVEISDEDFEVKGRMGSSHDANVHIVVRPRRNADYAPSYLNALPKL